MKLQETIVYTYIATYTLWKVTLFVHIYIQREGGLFRSYFYFLYPYVYDEHMLILET